MLQADTEDLRARSREKESNPLFCALGLLAYFALGVGILGMRRSLVLVLLALPFVHRYLVGKGMVGKKNAILMVLYLIVFDAPAYSLTGLNIRVWYPILLVLALMDVRRIFRYVFQYRFLLLGFLLYSALFLLIEPPIAKVFNIKYWMFTVLLWLELGANLSDLNEGERKTASSWMLSLFIFVNAWGFVQMLALVLGKGGVYMANPQFVRPDAFFSETTWYATYCFFGFMFLIYYANHYKKYWYLLLCLPFLAGMLVSNTRNAFLSLGIAAIVYILYRISQIRGVFSRKKAIVLVCIVVATCLLAFALREKIADGWKLIQLKMKLEDASAKGRLDAIDESLEMIRESWLFGHGFYWDESMVVRSSGTAIGAKSFNIFLQITHIFGVLGLVGFLVAAMTYGVLLTWRLLRRPCLPSIIALMLFVSFFTLSSFAPVHQFPFGMQLLATSTVLSAWSRRGEA